MSEQSIYIGLRQMGFPAVAACGIMGNLRDESAMRANNVEDRMHSELGWTDEEYIAAVDNGSYADFERDGGRAYGVGLAQWTAPSRKRKLLGYAQARGVSVGNEKMQVELIGLEMRADFPAVWEALQREKSVYKAAEIVCLKYEIPANAASKVDRRAHYANEYYMRFGGMEIPSEQPGQTEQEPEPSSWPPREALAYGDTGADVLVLQALLLARGYNLGAADGIFGQRTHNALAGFQAAEFGAGNGACNTETWNALLARR